MKLLSLTNRYYFISIVFILTLGGIFAYYVIKNIVNHEFNEKLLADKDQFLYEWHTYSEIQEVFYLNIGDRINISRTTPATRWPMVMHDTLMWDDYEKRELPFRRLTFSDELNGEVFNISITKSLLPTEDLITGISEIILLLMVSVIFSLMVVNRQISKKIWAPFYDTISKLKRYKIATHSNVDFPPTIIYEFSQLNEELKNMLEKSRADYNNLKEFTENASHEIQTPLAIIKSKAELLLQDGELSEADLEEVNKISEAASRLSRLKTGLVMLTKMENHQFEDVEPINLVEFIDKKLTYFEELIEIKDINVTKDYQANPTLILNNMLAFVLINNLLNNAIKHNVKGGYLTITVMDGSLVFENSGKPLDMDPQVLFQRFKKGSTSVDSSGLGLAIVKKVCDIYDMQVHYTIQGTSHKIEIIY